MHTRCLLGITCWPGLAESGGRAGVTWACGLHGGSFLLPAKPQGTAADSTGQVPDSWSQKVRLRLQEDAALSALPQAADVTILPASRGREDSPQGELACELQYCLGLFSLSTQVIEDQGWRIGGEEETKSRCLSTRRWKRRPCWPQTVFAWQHAGLRCVSVLLSSSGVFRH